ncbi:HWE histidine kinase domain-containing protein [Microvirga aerilata]|uniref:HWE histidine kinase domain-containing protein n=1 Tax=Microvirga aerilata TaxID=670292 RepID=UPI003635F7C8
MQSITSQTLRNAATARDARDALEGRLLALSRTHDVLTRENWESAELREIIEQAVEPYRGQGRIVFTLKGHGFACRPGWLWRSPWRSRSLPPMRSSMALFPTPQA